MADEYILIYTVEEGGLLHVYGRVTMDEFETIVKTRQILSRSFTGDEQQVIIPYYIRLLRFERDWDFVMGRPR